jgi:hypothetical protein
MSILDRGNGTYEQERVYVIATIERLERESKEHSISLETVKERACKQELDVNAAHDKIRQLEEQEDKTSRHLLRLELRAGSIAALAGAVVGILIELGKHFLFSR